MKKSAPSRSGTQVPRQSSRRQVLGGIAAAGALAAFSAPTVWAARQPKPKVIVIGGGFAGASCARFIKSADRGVDVTLLEPNPTYIACPLSNAVIAGLRELTAQQFGYRSLRAQGIDVLHRRATAVDAEKHTVT